MDPCVIRYFNSSFWGIFFSFGLFILVSGILEDLFVCLLDFWSEMNGSVKEGRKEGKKEKEGRIECLSCE